MENAETILVVFLSTFLAIFLFLGIVLLVKSIQIADSIKRITAKAENLVDQAESIGEFFKASSGSFAVGKLLSHIANAVFNRDKSNKKGS